MSKKTLLLISLLVLPLAASLQAQVDLSKSAVVLPFESTVKGAPGLADSTRTAVMEFLKDEGVFTAVLTSEEAKDKDKTTLLEIGATLSDFAPGNTAKRVLIGMGSGRAHAGFDFTIKDASGRIVWQKKIKETASFWSNSSSSAAQRQELPEKVAKTLLKELQKAKTK